MWALRIVAAAAAVRAAGSILPAEVALIPALALVLCLPGYAALRVLGLDVTLGGPGTLAAVTPAGLAVWAVALASGMLVQVPLTWLTVLVLAASAVALGRCRPVRLDAGCDMLIALAGSGLVAALAWRWKPDLMGDMLFHAGRVRKLLDLPDISLRGVSSFHNGWPHAGYVLPLLHAVQAAAIGVAGLEPSDSYTALVIPCAALAPLAVFGAGHLLGGRAVAVAATVIAMWDAFSRPVINMAEQPPGFTFLVMFPAAIAVIAAWARRPGDRRLQAAVAASVTVVAIVHATYAIVLLASLAAVVVLTRRGLLALVAAAGMTGLTYAVIWFVALRGAAREPGSPASAHTFVKIGDTPLMLQGRWIVHGRSDVLMALLALVPLLLLLRRRHALVAALMAGALALAAVPGAITLAKALFGAGQAKRMWDGIPWQFAAATALAALATALPDRRRLAAVAAALAAASLAYYLLGGQQLGSWPVVSSIAVAASGIVIWLALRGAEIPVSVSPAAGLVPVGLLLAAVLAGPVVNRGLDTVHVLTGGVPADSAALPRLPMAVIAYMRAHDAPPFPVVLAEEYASYQLVGQADTYAVDLPPERTRAEPRNHPATRRAVVGEFFSPGTTDARRRLIMNLFGVRYVLINAATLPRGARAVRGDPDLRPVLRGGSWTLYSRRQPSLG